MAGTKVLNTIFRAGLIAATLLPVTPAFAANEAMLDLLKILREKGSITADEYDVLVNAAHADQEKLDGAKAELKQGIDERLAKAPASLGGASWASRVKVKGDVRLRYQKQDEDGSEDRGRGRLRYRVGVIGKPTEGVEVGAGLASGGDDLRSTNQSFDESFSTKGINLDYAYAQYEFTDHLKVIGGKFPYKGYLWRTSDLMWDSDINPEGASANFALKNDIGTLFLNGGLWVLEEEGSTEDDPHLVYGQLGQSFSSGDVFGTVAGAVYGFEDIGSLGAVSGHVTQGGTNTDSQWSAFGVSGELGMRMAGGKAAVFSDVVNNFDTDTNKDFGFSIGAKYDRGAWGFKYIYANLDLNAWPDFLPDSDRFDGLTGIKAHEFVIDYEILKNVTVGVDYYHATDKATDVDQDLVQLDVNVKF